MRLCYINRKGKLNMNNKVVTFSKPFTFEGETYEKIDLSRIEDLTGAQLCNCERQFEQGGSVSALKEMNFEFCMIVAAEVSKLPIEFFKALPAKDGNKIRQVVSTYFFQQD